MSSSGLLETPVNKTNGMKLIWKKPYIKTTILMTLAYGLFNIGWSFINFFMPEILAEAGISGYMVYLIIVI